MKHIIFQRPKKLKKFGNIWKQIKMNKKTRNADKFSIPWVNENAGDGT